MEATERQDGEHEPVRAGIVCMKLTPTNARKRTYRSYIRRNYSYPHQKVDTSCH